MGGLKRSKTAMQDLLWRRSLFETRPHRKEHGKTSFRPNLDRIDHHHLVFVDGHIFNGD